MQYGAVTLFFALTQAGRAHAREKRKRCEEQRLGNAFGRRGGFVLGDGRSVFERGRACFCRQKRGMKIPGGARRTGKGHDPQARGPGRAERGVLSRRGRAWRRAAKARRHSPARGELPCAGCAAASAPACPSPWLCRTLSTRRGFLLRGGDVHATLQSSGVLPKGEARRLPEGERRRKRKKKTPVARMRQEQISGALADQMLW